MAGDNTAENSIYEWRKVFTIDEGCSDADKAMFIEALDNMEKTTGGIELLKSLTEQNKNIYLTNRIDGNKSMFLSRETLETTYKSYENLLKLEKYYNEHNDNNKNNEYLKSLKPALLIYKDRTEKCAQAVNCSDDGILNISFEELRAWGRVDAKDGRIIALTLPFILQHEGYHAGEEVSGNIRKPDIQNYLSKLYSEIYSDRNLFELDFLADNKESPEHPEYKEDYERLIKNTGLFERYKQIKTSIEYFEQSGLDYKHESKADRAAERHATDEPERKSYTFIVNLKTPLNEVITYPNGGFDINKMSDKINAAHGSRFITNNEIDDVLRVDYEKLDQKSQGLMKNDLQNCAHYLRTHDIKYIDIDKLSENELFKLTPLELDVLKRLSLDSYSSIATDDITRTKENIENCITYLKAHDAKYANIDINSDEIKTSIKNLVNITTTETGTTQLTSLGKGILNSNPVEKQVLANTAQSMMNGPPAITSKHIKR